MILTCPQCDTRYQADAAKFRPAGRNVRCAKCGHLWHQDPPPPEPDALVETAEPEPPPPPPAPPLAAPVAPPRPQAFAPNPVIAREAPAPVVQPRARSRWPMRIAVGLGWMALVAVILSLGWSALAFRQQIATIWPQSASLYAALGMKAQTSGLDIQNYASTRARENGQSVLVVSGTVANTGARELPVPQIRAALTDEESRELYHWTFMPGVMTLKPGQTTKFRSRLTNPPGGGSHIELRFVREGE